jgi:hypothetical protein
MIDDFINYLRGGESIAASVQDARQAVAAGSQGAASLRENSIPLDVPE